MPPKGKKKGAKGKKKAGKKEGGDSGVPPLGVQERVVQVEAKIQGLEREFEERTEIFYKEQAAASELRDRVLKYQRDYEGEMQERRDIITDMTRQYKQKQEDLCDKINQLENMKAELLDHKELQRLACEEMKREKEEELQLKDRIIEEQKSKIQVVTQEFQAMLKDTLNRLVEKVQRMHEDSQIIDHDSHDHEKEREEVVSYIEEMKAQAQNALMDAHESFKNGVTSMSGQQKVPVTATTEV